MKSSGWSPAQEGIDIRHYWHLVLSRWFLVGAVSVLGMLVAGLYLYLTPKTYTASSTLSVYPLSTDRYAANRNVDNLIDMGAEAVMASSFKVSEAAAGSLQGEWTVAELRHNTTVAAAAESTTMTVRVSADSEERARLGASAVADAYLFTRSQEAEAGIQKTVERDREKLDQYRTQLSDALERVALAEPGSSEAAQANADQQVLNLQVSTLLSRIDDLEGIDTTGGVVLNPASMTRIQVEPSSVLVLATGAGLGLIAGLSAAVAIPIRHRYVRSARDLSRELEVDTLATLGGESRDFASAAQRIIRCAEVHDARVVAFLFDEAVTWPVTLVDDLALEIKRSGLDVSVSADRSENDAADNGLVLIPVPSTASASERLHKLRISDAAVLVLRARATKIRNTDAMMRQTQEMGGSLMGVLLLVGKMQSLGTVPEPGGGNQS